MHTCIHIYIPGLPLSAFAGKAPYEVIMWARMHMFVCICMYVYKYMHTCIYIYIYLVCHFPRLQEGHLDFAELMEIKVCMYVCMYVRMYVCMYV